MSEAYTRKALKLLINEPCPTSEFLNLVVGPDRKDYVKSDFSALIGRLKRNKLVRIQGGKYYITDVGRVFAEPDSPLQATGNAVDRMGGSYKCPELGRTCFRPGAYDFLDIPSVFGSERRPYSFKSGIN